MGRDMRRGMHIGGIVSLLLVVAFAAPAAAACHAFTVSVDPDEVTEGDTVTVTVTRDAAVQPSSVDVATADGTAVAGQDYEALSETADFPDGGTSQTFTVATFDLTEARGDRTFQVELSNPQGCAVNPNYTVGPPAEVTIVDTAAPDPTEPADDPTEDLADDATDEAGDELAQTGSSGAWAVAGLLALLLALGVIRHRVG